VAISVRALIKHVMVREETMRRLSFAGLISTVALAALTVVSSPSLAAAVSVVFNDLTEPVVTVTADNILINTCDETGTTDCVGQLSTFLTAATLANVILTERRSKIVSDTLQILTDPISKLVTY
jgi:hypothetical protein